MFLQFSERESLLRVQPAWPISLNSILMVRASGSGTTRTYEFESQALSRNFRRDKGKQRLSSVVAWAVTLEPLWMPSILSCW